VTRYFAIVNPHAGGGRSGARANAALDAIRREGIDVEAVRTMHAGHAIELARQAYERGERRFLAVGGDGTSHEIINGALPVARAKKESLTLAMLPLGTGNSFLRDFGVTSSKAALRAITRGREHTCDVNELEHARGKLLSFNIIGLGFSATVGAVTNRRYKPLGAAGYVVGVVQTTLTLEYPSYPLRLDGGALDERPVILLSFSNSQCTAGAMKMAPRADPSDGQLDVIRIGKMSRRLFLRQFPSIFRGEHVLKDGVEQTRARRVELSIDREVDCMIDGEIVRLTPRVIEVVPKALTVVA
jgi:YegS/Rv2252/BmrU family lipid kinase